MAKSRQVVFRATAVFAAGLLAVAGLSKLLSPDLAALGHEVLQWPRHFVVGLAVLEIGIAWWLIRGCYAECCRWVVLALFLLYLTALGWYAFHGAGAWRFLGAVSVPLAGMVAVDGLVVLGMVLGRPSASRSRIGFGEVVAVSGFLVGFWAIGATAPELSSADFGSNPIHVPLGYHASWHTMTRGTPIQAYKVFRQTRPDDRLQRGKWVLFYSRPDCAQCRGAMGPFRSLASRTADWNFGIVTVPPVESREPTRYGGEGLEEFSLSSHDGQGRMTWIVPVPCFVVISDGTFVAACRSVDELAKQLAEGPP